MSERHLRYKLRKYKLSPGGDEEEGEGPAE
jgi:hypothetical protein